MTHSPERYRQDSRLRSVTLIGWGVLLLGLVNFWRSIGVYRQIEVLRALNVVPDPQLRFIISVVWGIIFTALALAIWRRTASTRWLVPVTLTVYAIYRAGIYLTSPEGNGVEIVWVFFFAVWILFSIWALNRAEAERYYRRGN